MQRPVRAGPHAGPCAPDRTHTTVTIIEGATLEFFGANDSYGTDRCDLNEERYVDKKVADDAILPFGVKGMLPVVTARRKKGGFKTVYAFPFAEGAPDESDALAHELCEATGFVNMLLGEARELSGYEFGVIGALNLGVSAEGYCFTRVEVIPGKGRAPAAAPIHLRLETTDVACEPGSLSASVEYDPDGYVRHVSMTEYAENGQVLRAMADYDWHERGVYVFRVTRTPAGAAADVEPEELYRRYPKREYDDDYGYGCGGGRGRGRGQGRGRGRGDQR